MSGDVQSPASAIRQIPVARPTTGDEEIEAVAEVIRTGQFVSGHNVSAFEDGFAEYVGTQGGCAVNNGTAALHVSMIVMGIGPGDEVIVPPMTFMSTITAVLHQNAIPIFADIDPQSYCIDPADVERKITPRTKAVIPVHLYGNAAEMDELMDIARRHDIYVIEDCAQAHGTEYKGRRVGSIGDVGAFSFYATKHMTTGEGGMITSNNPNFIEQAKVVRSHGMVNRDDHVRLGYNYRMDEISGAMGRVQLGRLEENNLQRIENSEYLLNALRGHDDKWFRVPEFSSHIRHTYFWCPLAIQTEDGYATEDVVSRLREQGIEVRQRYTEPLYKQPVMQKGGAYPNGCPFDCSHVAEVPNYADIFLPHAEAASGNLLGLPNHPGLERSDLDYVIHNVLNLY